jgi:hypothetical protein
MDIATTVEATAAAVGVLAMLGTGVFGLGKFQATMDANTRSNEKLANVIDGHLIWAQAQVDEARDKFAEHDKRISVVETRLEK